MDKISIVSFEKNHTLEDILSLLKLDYNRGNGINLWKKFYEEELEIKNIEFDEELEIRYIPTLAYIDDVEGMVKQEKMVVFFEYDDVRYCAMVGTESSFKQIRPRLMGNTREKTYLSEQWGKLIFSKKIPTFNFSDDFFKWVYTKYNGEIATKYGTLKMVTMIGMENSDSSVEDLAYRTEGAKINNDIVAKTCLAANKLIKLMGFHIEHEKFKIQFKIGETGEGFFNRSDSMIKNPHDIYVTPKDYDKAIIYALVTCLQGMKDCYKDEIGEGTWNSDLKSLISKNESLKVIEDLIGVHNSKEDVFKMLVEKHKLSKEYVDLYFNNNIN